jgi:hypothetical protein
MKNHEKAKQEEAKSEALLILDKLEASVRKRRALLN